MPVVVAAVAAVVAVVIAGVWQRDKGKDCICSVTFVVYRTVSFRPGRFFGTLTVNSSSSINQSIRQSKRKNERFVVVSTRWWSARASVRTLSQLTVEERSLGLLTN